MAFSGSEKDLSYISKLKEFDAEYIGKNKRHIPITKFGPLLFTLYIAPLQDVIACHNLNSLFYANDTQLCIAIDPANQAPSLTALQTCIENVMRWNTQNMLRSNAERQRLFYSHPDLPRHLTLRSCFLTVPSLNKLRKSVILVLF